MVLTLNGAQLISLLINKWVAFFLQLTLIHPTIKRCPVFELFKIKLCNEIIDLLTNLINI